jgi:hypothetical protein
MFEALGITEVLDRATTPDPEMRMVTAGPAVTARVLNGLGFLNQPLDLVPHFFQTQPLARLMAPGMPASHRNDDTLGRTLDTLYDFGGTALSCLMAATAATRLGLTRRCSQRATTRLHGDGRSHSAQPPDAQVGPSTQGSSRAQRPDRNHVMVELVGEHQAGTPGLRQPRRGKSHDGTAVGQVLRAPMAPLHTAPNPTSLVAGSALESAENRHQLAQTRLKGIPRGPATLHAAQAVLPQAAPQTMAPLTAGSRSHVVPSR